ncbi:superfamily II DNA/RNA helicase [Xanthomonas translucens]
MFDSATVALIRSAPDLEGLDLDVLPSVLTAAYAKIVTARVRLRQSINRIDQRDLEEDVAATVTEMRRLAFSQEALISLSPNRDDRAAGAFVSGAAHHVVLQALRLLTSANSASELSVDGVPAEVSATLLFLIAESHADSSEMAKLIRAPGEGFYVEKLLLDAIANLAKGAVDKILVADEPSPALVLTSEPGQRAASALYLMLLKGLKSLASRLSGLESDDPLEQFKRVADLSTRTIQDSDGSNYYSTFPGPGHLAALLTAVARDLPDSALVNLPPPTGVDHGPWVQKMAQIARGRPFLWRNHLQAVAEGYLEPGVSSVVSFPTGAGKSTLSELKIAACLIRSKKVIFLSPTLALVDQTARVLKELFPQAELQKEKFSSSAFDFAEEDLPAISVMTPERCLAVMSYASSSFDEVGLMVFDECHLLHPRGSDRSRRALDAMLCLLKFSQLSTQADYLLLSAMMSNSVDLAEWIADLTGRKCLSLNLTWKPTRQVRGCVVYGASDLQQLRARLLQSRAEVRNVNPPAAVAREMRARPFGLFCLHQTWQSRRREDYSLLPLLDSKVVLSTGTANNKSWYLTPNGIRVASNIAIGAASPSSNGPGLKTLVFTQTIPHANSAVRYINEEASCSGCLLTEGEKEMFQAALDELGAADHLYVKVEENFCLSSASLPHHGLLLPTERRLHESLYKRADGVDILVATSTIAQGMNLPSQVVIIASDSRFDPGANQMERLEAHELLNAAGRAGRAGEASYGFVLVVPSKVMDFDDQRSAIHSHWSELQAIFSQSDQCLEIEDPIAPVLDSIYLAGYADGDIARYLLRRLPILSKQDNPDEAANQLLNRSMGAYFKRREGDSQWISTRIASALAARRNGADASQQPDWMDHLASSAGVDRHVVQNLSDRLDQVGPTDGAHMQAWVDFVFNWIQDQPSLVFQLLRPESLENFFGHNYRVLPDDEARCNWSIPRLRVLLSLWIRGLPLVEIEREFGTPNSRLGCCEHAREFVLRIVPELAYIFAMPDLVLQARARAAGVENEFSAVVTKLGACVREGFDQVEKLALQVVLPGQFSRMQVHRIWSEMEWLVLSPLGIENWTETIARVRSANTVRGAI